MSDIRFEGWLHRSGTGGVYQDSAGNVGIASTQPKTRLDIQNGAFQIGPAGICTATTVNTTNLINETSLSHRNLIINGAMQVAQRGTSSTAVSGYHTIDRYSFNVGGTDETPTVAQVDVSSGTTPYTLGFKKALKITNGNQTGGAGAADYMEIYQYLEDQDISNSGWNFKSSSSYITISFWVKSSVAQNFYITLIAYDSPTYMYAFETGGLSADTWTKVTHSIPGNSNLTFNNDDGLGLEINWYQYAGTNYTDGSHSLNTWGAYSGNNLMPDMTSTWNTTNDATWELTGVQLEVGDIATSFEHRSYGEELARCQRYFYGPTGEGLFGVGRTTNASTMWSVQFPTQMRGNPSLSITSTTITIAEPNQSNFNITSATIANAHISKNTAAFYLNGTMSVSVGDNLFLTDDYLMFSADL